MKTYIEWILSPAGQKIVGDSGYVPVATTGSDDDSGSEHDAEPGGEHDGGEHEAESGGEPTEH